MIPHSLMKQHAILLPLFFLALASIAQAADPPPVPKENTVALFGNDSAHDSAEIRDDSSAYRGACIVPKTPYGRIATATIPENGNPLHIWARYRNLALQMKTRKEDETLVFPWSWARHKAEFAWRKIGSFAREEIGDSIYLIHDPNFDETSGLDALVITADPDWRPADFSQLPPPSLTADTPDEANATVQRAPILVEESNEPGKADVTIDWNDRLGKVQPFIYSLNNFRGHSPERMSNPDWHKAHAHMGTRLMRLHSSGLVRAWYDPDKDDWNYDYIREALNKGTPPKGTLRMININSWPVNYDKNEDRRLDEDRIEDFARLCADLVRFVNIEMEANIKYWEVTNEKDFAYWRKPAPGLKEDVGALAKIYNTAATAMRKVDPTIKIGGPAACSPLPPEPIVKFALLTRDNLDFLSFHHYATGKNTDPDQVIYAKAMIMADDSKELIRQLKEAMPTRDIEVHLNEYNICYSWRIPEPRMTNHKGAVFDAISLISYAAVPGLTAANAWNDLDGVYGKADSGGTLRPGAHIYHYFNRFLQGERVAISTSDPTSVLAFAILGEDNERPAFVLINRTNGIRTVTLKGEPEPEISWLTASIDAEGHHEAAPANPFATPPALPPHSVTFFWAK